jgi:hypothetical protein
MKQKSSKVYYSIPHPSNPIMRSPKKVYLAKQSVGELLSIPKL